MNTRTVTILLLLSSLATSAFGGQWQFPPDFIFGAGTAAYQIEGAWNEDDRSPSIWDDYCHTHHIANGDVACDSYHQLDRDMAMIQELGLDSYRFSISWSRILPTGNVKNVNSKAIHYYNRIIDALLAMRVQPIVTMYHWDHPDAFEKQFDGFASPQIIRHFTDFAQILFAHFGDRVKKWFTFNEPTWSCVGGYELGSIAPGKHNPGIGSYQCAHNTLLAHAHVYRLYQRDYKATQKGEIGFIINSFYVDGSKTLQEQYFAFNVGWFVDPLYAQPFHGYPKIMVDEIGLRSRLENRSRSRLPSFTDADRQLLDRSIDFLGINYYTSRRVQDSNRSSIFPISYYNDMNVTLTKHEDCKASASDWLCSYPIGIYGLLRWIADQYPDLTMFISENGWSDHGQLEDTDRIEYLTQHLAQVARAKSEGVNVQGYYHWSLMDNFEWMDGYSNTFGLYQVNFTDPQRKRTPKYSAAVYRDIIRQRKIIDPNNPDRANQSTRDLK